jgi:hypothetical protein
MIDANITSVHCIMLSAFPNFRMHGSLVSFGYPFFLSGITMLSFSSIMMEFRVGIHSVVDHCVVGRTLGLGLGWEKGKDV